MDNLLGIAISYLEEKGIDTSNMTAEEILTKYNEMIMNESSEETTEEVINNDVNNDVNNSEETEVTEKVDSEESEIDKLLEENEDIISTLNEEQKELFEKIVSLIK